MRVCVSLHARPTRQLEINQSFSNSSDGGGGGGAPASPPAAGTPPLQAEAAVSHARMAAAAGAFATRLSSGMGPLGLNQTSGLAALAIFEEVGAAVEIKPKPIQAESMDDAFGPAVQPLLVPEWHPELPQWPGVLGPRNAA